MKQWFSDTRCRVTLDSDHSETQYRAFRLPQSSVWVEMGIPGKDWWSLWVEKTSSEMQQAETGRVCKIEYWRLESIPETCRKPPLKMQLIHDVSHVSMLFSQISPPSPSPTESSQSICSRSHFYFAHVKTIMYFPVQHTWWLQRIMNKHHCWRR